jgi:leader peptidase (prepilin peptidase)/N-methyltransferase
LFLLLFRRYGLEAQFFIEALFVSLLVLIAFIDLDTFEIPHVLSMPGIAAGLVLSFLTPRLTWLDSLLGILIGGGLFFAVAVLYAKLRNKEGLGGGDIYLLAMIGAFLGVRGVIFTVFFSSLIGTMAGIWVMRRSGESIGSAMIPYGPFLALGGVCHIFFGETLIQWYLNDMLGL